MPTPPPFPSHRSLLSVFWDDVGVEREAGESRCMEELIVKLWEEQKLTGVADSTTPAPLGEHEDTLPAGMRYR